MLIYKLISTHYMFSYSQFIDTLNGILSLVNLKEINDNNNNNNNNIDNDK